MHFQRKLSLVAGCDDCTSYPLAPSPSLPPCRPPVDCRTGAFPSSRHSSCTCPQWDGMCAFSCQNIQLAHVHGGMVCVQAAAYNPVMRGQVLPGPQSNLQLRRVRLTGLKGLVHRVGGDAHYHGLMVWHRFWHVRKATPPVPIQPD